MFGPYTPTLLALLSKHGKIRMPKLAAAPIPPESPARHKVAVVTGAASGIGAAFAKVCANKGMHLVLADNAWISSDEDNTPMENPYHHPLVNELVQKHGEQQVTALHTDVGKKGEIQSLHDTAVKKHGRVHYLFNNAGTGMPGVLSATDESMKRAFDINFWSVIHGMRIFVPTMELNEETSFIVNTASLAGISEACGLYGVTKHAVVAATEAVASELAWRESKIHVSVLCPSYVKSNVGRTTQRARMTSIESEQIDDGSEDQENKQELENIMNGLSILIDRGMNPMDVARLTFDGLANRHKYHYTNSEHTKAALDDRMEQLRANGMTHIFRRRMEDVVSASMGPSMGGGSQTRAMSTSSTSSTTNYYKLHDQNDSVTDMLRKVVGNDRLTFNSSIIQNHGSLEEGYHGWNPPDAVAFATSTADVSKLMQICNKHRVPVVSYGTGTSVEGHIDCTRGGLMIDLSRMNAILSVDVMDSDATVECGVTREQLNDNLRHQGLFFSVDPGANASIGGMVATNASGTTTIKYGNMCANVKGLTVVGHDGTVMKMGGRSNKSSAGYDMTSLMIGSEGTLGIITEVIVKLHPQPEATSAAVVQFNDLASAVKAASESSLMTGMVPARMELLDAATMKCLDGYQGQVFDHKPMIFFEYHGTTDEVKKVLDILPQSLEGSCNFRSATAQEDINSLWKARHDAFWAVKAKYPGLDVIATDVCVPVSKLAEIVEKTAEDIVQLGVVAAPLFGHVGDGNFHLLVLFDRADPTQVEQVRKLEDRLIRSAISMGGTCTGEHGIGTGKKQYLELEFGKETVTAMRTIKAALDPTNILNPDKVV
jgi:D-lactate dehydrogenase (cytochrome)